MNNNIVNLVYLFNNNLGTIYSVFLPLLFILTSESDAYPVFLNEYLILSYLSNFLSFGYSTISATFTSRYSSSEIIYGYLFIKILSTFLALSIYFLFVDDVLPTTISILIVTSFFGQINVILDRLKLYKESIFINLIRIIPISFFLATAVLIHLDLHAVNYLFISILIIFFVSIRSLTSFKYSNIKIFILNEFSFSNVRNGLSLSFNGLAENLYLRIDIILLPLFISYIFDSSSYAFASTIVIFLIMFPYGLILKAYHSFIDIDIDFPPTLFKFIFGILVYTSVIYLVIYYIGDFFSTYSAIINYMYFLLPVVPVILVQRLIQFYILSQSGFNNVFIIYRTLIILSTPLIILSVFHLGPFFAILSTSTLLLYLTARCYYKIYA